MARGSLRKRGDVWYAYWRDASGRQRAKAVGTRKKDAERFLNQITAELDQGTYKELRAITFQDFAENWLRDYAAAHVKPSTLQSYRATVRNSFIPFFGPVNLSAIQPDDVQRYVAERLATGVRAATVHRQLTVLKGMMRRAVEWDYLRINPAATIKPPRIEHVEMDFLTPPEIVTFLDAVDPTYHALFFTAIFTGMRSGELRALLWSDIDWNSSTIRVRRSVWRGAEQLPKSRASVRTVGMSNRLRQVLDAHRVTVPSGGDHLVFPNTTGGFIDDNNLRKRVFEPALSRAGLRKIRIHDLRHTFASLLINQGENLKYVQQQLGHASITTTVDRYGHLMPDAHMDACNRLDGVVFGHEKTAPVDNVLTIDPEKKTGQRAVAV